MPKIKLTAASVRDIPSPVTGQVFYYDLTLPGFGLRVGTKSKVYYAEARVNGRTRRVTLGTSTTLPPDDARRAAKKVLGQMADGQDVNAKKAEARAKSITLQEALDRYLAARENLKPKTVADYRHALRLGCPDWLPREVKAITPAMTVARFQKIATERGEATANIFARTLRAVWNYALHDTARDDGTPTLPINPVARISALRLWKEEKKRQTYLPPAGFPALAGFLAAERVRNPVSPFPDFIELLLRTGLRRSEAAGLTWANVDLQARTLRAVDTKNGRDHTLPLSNQLLALLTRRKEAATGPNVFAESGMALDPRHSLEKMRKAVDLPIKLHDLRRTFATLADALDLPGYAVKMLLNHATGDDVTAAHYVVRSVDRLRQPMQRISEEIDRLSQIDLKSPN